jgi:hypothetical protein
MVRGGGSEEGWKWDGDVVLGGSVVRWRPFECKVSAPI